MTDQQPTGFELSAVGNVAATEDEGQILEIHDHRGAPLTFTAPDGTEKPVTVRVAGTYSKVYRRAQEMLRERQIRQRRAKLTGEAVTRQSVELVAACILGWDGFFNAGQPLAYERENVIEVLTRAPWIREQVEEAMVDHEGFFTSSSSS